MVKLRFADAIGPKTFDDIGEGRLDLMILPEQTLAPWLDSEPLIRSDFRIVARRGHPELTRHGKAPGLPLPIDLYCRLRHVAFQ